MNRIGKAKIKYDTENSLKTAKTKALTEVFTYLKVHELLRAARVCRMWRDSAVRASLWKKLSLKNSLVTDWNAFAETLQLRGTEHLDLRKMLIDVENVNETWDKFVSVIPSITSLTKLDLCKCPATVVQHVIQNCPNLEIFNAMYIESESLNLEFLGNLSNCCELRLKSMSCMSLEGDLSCLLKLTNLTHLSLTTVKNWSKDHMNVIKSLVKLQSLELGECVDFSFKFGTTVLIKLKNLCRLRLEKGQDECNIFDIFKGVSKLKKLTELELINFDVKPGFEKHLACCKNIKMLLIIPTYVSQSATTSHLILKSAGELTENLTHFVWGVTQELLKVTELFRDDSEQPSKKMRGDSIPVLKPVPFSSEVVNKDVEKEKNTEPVNLTNPEIDIVPLSQLQELLTKALPNSKVKILKIPFHATWRINLSQVTYK